MTQIIIDGKSACIPADLEFSLKLDNPYFTKSSSHSLEVELPAELNRHIFGVVNRLDSTRPADMLPCELVCDGVVMLAGKAGILGMTEKTVKIQLVAGLSELNFANRKDIYLDETEWGVPPEFEKSEGYEFLAVFHDNNEIFSPKYYKDGTSSGDLFNPAQVYLWKLFELVVGRFGFTIGKSVLHETWLRYIVCIGAYVQDWMEWHGSISDEWRALPHWTVKDFLTEIEKFTGSVIYIDESNRKVNVIGLNEYFSGRNVVLNDVVDEYECSVQDEEDKDNHTVGNMAYQLPTETDNGYARLKREVFASAEKRRFSSMQELNTAWDGDTPESKNRTIYITRERHYITRDGKLTEVDTMGDLIRDVFDEKIHTYLKIVPAALEERERKIYEKNLAGMDNHIGSVNLMVPSVYMIASPATSKIKNVQEAIEGKEKIEKAQEKDVMEVSICTRQKYNMSGTSISCLSLYNDYNEKPSAQSDKNMEISLCLRDVCRDSLGCLQSSIDKIESGSLYSVSFLYKGLPDVRDIFLIRNQKYIAKTITIRVNAHGFEPIMEGEFYKI